MQFINVLMNMNINIIVKFVCFEDLDYLNKPNIKNLVFFSYVKIV